MFSVPGPCHCPHPPQVSLKDAKRLGGWCWGKGWALRKGTVLSSNPALQVNVGEGSHPERVKVYGPGVEKTGLKANEPTYFTVDCSEAGQGSPRLGMGVGVGPGQGLGWQG